MTDPNQCCKNYYDELAISTQHTEIEDLKRKLEIAENALNFYASPSDYKSPFTGGLGKLYFDCGEVARQSLEAINSTGEQK